jgi:hypothetical protein
LHKPTACGGKKGEDEMLFKRKKTKQKKQKNQRKQQALAEDSKSLYDPLGMYTGTPSDGGSPTQDADDL